MARVNQPLISFRLQPCLDRGETTCEHYYSLRVLPVTLRDRFGNLGPRAAMRRLGGVSRCRSSIRRPIPVPGYLERFQNGQIPRSLRGKVLVLD